MFHAPFKTQYNQIPLRWFPFFCYPPLLFFKSHLYSPIPLVLNTPEMVPNMWFHPLLHHGFWGVFDIRGRTTTSQPLTKHLSWTTSQIDVWASWNAGSPSHHRFQYSAIVIHELDDLGVPPWLRKPACISQLSRQPWLFGEHGHLLVKMVYLINSPIIFHELHPIRMYESIIISQPSFRV